jgi:hypothetical protein
MLAAGPSGVSLHHLVVAGGRAIGKTAHAPVHDLAAIGDEVAAVSLTMLIHSLSHS